MDPTPMIAFLTNLGNDKMFVGLTMIVMQLGSRFIITSMPEGQQQLLGSELMKKIVVFCMFFVPTRDIMTAAMLTFAFFFISGELLDETKNYSLLEGFDQGVRDMYDTYVKHIHTRRRDFLLKK